MKLSRFLYHHTPHGKYEVRRILAAGRVTVEGEVERDSQCEIGDFTNPLFPALRSGPTAGSGAYPKSKFLAASKLK